MAIQTGLELITIALNRLHISFPLRAQRSLAALKVSELAPPPAYSGSRDWTGSSSQPHTSHISYAPISLNVREPQQAQGYISSTSAYENSVSIDAKNSNSFKFSFNVRCQLLLSPKRLSKLLLGNHDTFK